jgi:hypothetical protein
MLFIALQAAAQSQKTVSDSINYYNRKILAIEQRVSDSLDHSQPYHYYMQQKIYWEGLSKNRKYTGLSYFNELAGADYGAFNRRIEQEGYAHFGGPLYRFGLGLSHMTNSGWVFDLNFFVWGIDKSSGNGPQIITTGFTEYGQLDVGYAVFSSRKFDIYPYAGLSLRSSDFFFSRPRRGGSTYNDIVGVDQGNGDIKATAVSPSYQAGASFEWIAFAAADRKFGTIVFLKAGTDGVFGHETYKIEGIKYDPGITYGNWGVALGIKII